MKHQETVIIIDFGGQYAQLIARRVRECGVYLSLIHISEPTRRTPISYAVFCLKKKKQNCLLYTSPSPLDSQKYRMPSLTEINTKEARSR